MKRREFVRNTLLFSASTFLVPYAGFTSELERKKSFEMLQSLQLTDFEDEQDESPILFQNKENAYLTTLRRLEYPSDKEIISLFHYQEGTWKEIAPVTKEAGSYEAISADCHRKGKAAVAWTDITNGQWTVQVALQDKNGFAAPVRLSDASKKAINPVVKAVTAKSFVVTWESFENGKFSIYLSRYKNKKWSKPVQVTDANDNCFNPAIEQDEDDNIYIAYDHSEGVHRNIAMKILNEDLETLKTVPIAVGGGFKDRININVKPALCFDKEERLWISWENNRNAHRLQDSDNYTGDRCCAMVCYTDGKLLQAKTTGKWLFDGANDHWPNFQKDLDGNLYCITHCGGDFTGNPFWKFRLSYLDPNTGWTAPETILQTKQKGESIRPTLAFDKEMFWLAWKSDNFKERDHDFEDGGHVHANQKDGVRRGKLEMNAFKAPDIPKRGTGFDLEPAVVQEHMPTRDEYSDLSGRPKSKRTTMVYKGGTYTLLLGNLHEHSEISSCWPAGTDGTLHDDYRFGLYSEGYDFMGITDHAYSQTEVYWRKHLRLAEFYNDSTQFVAFPSVEFTLSNRRAYEITRGAGHRNIVFDTVEDAKKYIRDKDQVFSVRNPETSDAEGLWKYIHDNDINCISIPHHPADEVHACCWETRDEVIEPIVEIFQCRGNAEYRGAPRMINLKRHQPTENDKGFIDYALREKKHKLGFIASGDHNSIGVGLACVWVKEVSRAGILEAIRNRRVFATTGDQIVMDFRVQDTLQGQTTVRTNRPKMSMHIRAEDQIVAIDVLRNSKVIKTIVPNGVTNTFRGTYIDSEASAEEGVLYYYLRVAQKNKQLAWSSPVWLEA